MKIHVLWQGGQIYESRAWELGPKRKGRKGTLAALAVDFGCGFLTIFDLQNEGDEWSKHEQIGASGEILNNQLVSYYAWNISTV